MRNWEDWDWSGNILSWPIHHCFICGVSEEKEPLGTIVARLILPTLVSWRFYCTIEGRMYADDAESDTDCLRDVCGRHGRFIDALTGEPFGEPLGCLTEVLFDETLPWRR